MAQTPLKIMQIAHFSAVLVQFYPETLHKTAHRISHVNASILATKASGETTGRPNHADCGADVSTSY
jgi:hypothetical protein